MSTQAFIPLVFRILSRDYKYRSVLTHKYQLSAFSITRHTLKTNSSTIMENSQGNSTDPRKSEAVMTDKSSIYCSTSTGPSTSTVHQKYLNYRERSINGLLKEGELPPFGFCYFCKSSDHWSPTCPQKKKSTEHNNCFACNSTEHWYKDCPLRNLKRTQDKSTDTDETLQEQPAVKKRKVLQEALNKEPRRNPKRQVRSTRL